MDCNKLVEQLKSEGRKEKEITSYKRICEKESASISAQYITGKSYSLILSGIVGGFVFVVALIFRDLITNTLFSLLPDLSETWNTIITILVFLGLVFAFVYVLMKVDKQNQKYEVIMKFKNIEI